MKKVSLLLLLMGIGLAAFAQDTDSYEAAMEKNIARLDSEHTATGFQELANNFEIIASAKSDQWLPYYYASLCRTWEAFTQQDKSKVDALADQAKSLADKADALNPDKAEMLCLRSQIASARISVDPQTRGMQYGPEAASDLEQAAKIAPNNPRIALLQGQSAFYTPAQWGGGKEVAKPLLEKALKLYADFKPASALAPNWGKTMAEQLLAKCNQ